MIRDAARRQKQITTRIERPTDEQPLKGQYSPPEADAPLAQEKNLKANWNRKSKPNWKNHYSNDTLRHPAYPYSILITERENNLPRSDIKFNI
jgi:hypothetical protein